MFVDIKNLETGEVIHENLEVTDIMHGAYEGDDRYIIFLPDGGQLVFSPRANYLISAHIELSNGMEQ